MHDIPYRSSELYTVLNTVIALSMNKVNKLLKWGISYLDTAKHTANMEARVLLCYHGMMHMMTDRLLVGKKKGNLRRLPVAQFYGLKVSMIGMLFLWQFASVMPTKQLQAAPKTRCFCSFCSVLLVWPGTVLYYLYRKILK